MISYDDFKKIEVRAGKIISAEKIPDTDKLLRLTVDFGEQEDIKSQNPGIENNGADAVQKETGEVAVITKVAKHRQIVSGISMHFPDPAVLVGKTCMFVTNLEPRVIRGYESNGMIFAVSTPEGGFSLLEPNSSITPGAKAS